jgi:hypothetical protein
MYNVERRGDELVVTSEMLFDMSTDYKELVLSIRQARRLTEALLEETTTLSMFAEPEDG